MESELLRRFHANVSLPRIYITFIETKSDFIRGVQNSLLDLKRGTRTFVNVTRVCTLAHLVMGS